MDTQRKLEILAQDAQYDLACACGTANDEHRRRGLGGKWLYPVTLPSGGHSILLKTLVSNACTNDCKYCPLRRGSNVARCSMTPLPAWARKIATRLSCGLSKAKAIRTSAWRWG